MPIQIPTLKRIEQADPTLGQDRTNPNIVPDLTRGMEQQTRAAEKLGSTAVNYFQQVADNEADTEATKRQTDFQMYRYNRLDQLTKEVGTVGPDDNPTKVFDRYNEDLDIEYKRLTENPEDSGLVKRSVNERLFKTKESFRLQDMMQYKQVNDQYQNRVDDSAIDLDRNEVVNNSGFIKRGDAETYAPFESSLENLRQRVIKKNIRNGNISTNEDGSIKNMNSIARVELGKNVSEAVSTSIDNALRSGFLEVAEGIKEKYWNQIDPVTQAKLGDTFKKADDDYTAHMYAREGDKALEGIKDPIRRDKIRDHGNRIKKDRMSEQQQLQELNQKRNYNLVMETIQKKGYTNLTQLEGDPVYAKVEDKMGHKLRQAVVDSVVAPKQSRDAALARTNFMLYGGTDEQGRTVREYEPSEFNELLSGLSKGDRSKALNLYGKFKSETGSETWAKTKKSHDYFKEQALALNLLNEDEFNRVSGKEFDKKIAWQNQLDEVIDSLGSNPPTKLVQETVRDFTVSLKKGEVYKPVNKKVAFNARPVPNPLSPPPAKTELSLEEKNRYASSFYQKNKRAANRKTGELDIFIKKEQDAGR